VTAGRPLILRNGELLVAHGAFVLKGDAIRWVEKQRKDTARGLSEEALPAEA
jgi:hypothetical protein